MSNATARPAQTLDYESKAAAVNRRPLARLWMQLCSDRLGMAHVALAAAMGALGIVAMLPAWQDIHRIAAGNEQTLNEDSHIFLVPLVALWLVWVRRTRLRHCKPSFRLIGPLIVAAGWIISLVGFYNGIQSFWHGGAVLVMIGCVLSVLGKNVLVRFFPAFAVLVFLVPVPSRYRLDLSLPLQSWTAHITQKVLDTMGLDAEVANNALRINGQNVTVAEACNGLRGVFALILVSYAFGFTMPLKNFVRFLILLASPLAAIFCNVIRLIPTMWMFGHYPPAIAQRFHDDIAWVMLPLAFLMLYGVIGTLRWAMIPVTRYTLASQT
jgi:exosortase